MCRQRVFSPPAPGLDIWSRPPPCSRPPWPPPSGCMCGCHELMCSLARSLGPRARPLRRRAPRAGARAPARRRHTEAGFRTATPGRAALRAGPLGPHPSPCAPRRGCSTPRTARPRRSPARMRRGAAARPGVWPRAAAPRRRRGMIAARRAERGSREGVRFAGPHAGARARPLGARTRSPPRGAPRGHAGRQRRSCCAARRRPPAHTHLRTHTHRHARTNEPPHCQERAPPSSYPALALLCFFAPAAGGARSRPRARAG